MGFTFDTGMLIALERRKRRAEAFLQLARERHVLPVVPAPVVLEWWRGRTDRREALLSWVRVESLDDRLARTVGEVLAQVRGATPIDAVVMASAASRGDVVLTSDPGDLEQLRSHFPAVRVLAV